MPSVDLLADPVALTARLVDIPSVSHEEKPLADALEHALRALPAVEVHRLGHTLIARTQRGLGSRVVLAGHIDTVPIADNVPHRRGLNAAGEDTLFGCGTVDMKSGLAVYLHAFATLAAAPELQRDLTLIAYEAEEVAAQYNGLGHVVKAHPEWVRGDVALLGEPSGGMIEAGCQGTIRIKITAHGVRAHSARAWMGDNAIHKLVPILEKVAAYRPRSVEIDGCEYREGLNLVRLEAGVANNTIPDEAWCFVNYRFAPDRSADAAMEHLLEVVGLANLADDDAHYTIEVDDVSPAALPGLGQPAAAELVAAVGGRVRAKYGWTDVARFAALGIPAVNFGPGDPSFAHKKDEQCPVSQITEVAAVLQEYLTRPTSARK